MYGVVVIVALCAFTQHTYAESSCKNCLFLTPHIKNGNASHARSLAAVDPLAYLGYESYSGFITVKEEYNSNMFFWFFPAETPLATTPWIIWLQGGPGFSSMHGLFNIIGPLSIQDGKVTERNVTWASDYSLLFLDNPVGAGFSFTENERGYTNNEDDNIRDKTFKEAPQLVYLHLYGFNRDTPSSIRRGIGAQMLELLKQFLKMFPELRKAPLFIAGQSYAGKYVPALGIQIHRYNTQNPKKSINLRGISIGNGLIELRQQMHYTELCRSLGFLDGDQLERLQMLEHEVLQLIDNDQLEDAANKFNQTMEYVKKQTGINIYNFIKDPSSKAPEFEHYITRPEVRELIHVGNASFDSNNQHVYYKMLPDFANSTKPFVEELLEHYGVMSYSGQLDVILPYSASKHLYASLNWSRRSEYLVARRRNLRRHLNGAVVGYKKAGGNFIEILVRDAGHSVPADQPDVAKFMIDLFIEQFK